MQINRELIEARIRELNDSIDAIGKLVSKSFGEFSLYEILSLRYLVIQLVEASSSICVHLIASVFEEKPEGYPECFSRLGTKGVIPEGLASKLSSAGRLRNLLVHRYWTISDELVYESVKEGLSDFREFINHIREFLEGIK